MNGENGRHPVFNLGLVAPVLLSIIGATAWIGLFYGGDHGSIARLERDVEGLKSNGSPNLLSFKEKLDLIASQVEKNTITIGKLPSTDAQIKTEIENIKLELSRYYAQKEEVTRLNSNVGAELAELAQRIKNVEERVRERRP